jgi:hypothetical protein
MYLFFGAVLVLLLVLCGLLIGLLSELHGIRRYIEED